jgi:hypothetical protein
VVRTLIFWGHPEGKESYPGYEQEARVGDGKFGKAAGAFLSKIKGREFALEEISPPQTNNGRMGLSILLKEVQRQLNESKKSN